MLRDVFNQEINIKKGVIALLVLGLVATTSVTGFLLANDNKDIVITKVDDSEQTEGAGNNGGKTADKGDENQEEELLDEIKVYVVGEVNKPGVVTLAKGQIIQDAIELAGGVTQDADIENINLAFELEENVMLRIRSRSESVQQDIGESGSVNIVASGDNAGGKSTAEGNSSKSVSARNVLEKADKTDKTDKADKAGETDKTDKTDKNNSGSTASGNKSVQYNYDETITGITITKGSGGAIVGENDNSKTSNAKININKATLEELDTLPGIGPSTAAKIISHREQNGSFKAIEDIMNVSGIGESKFNNIKDFITVK